MSFCFSGKEKQKRHLRKKRFDEKKQARVVFGPYNRFREYLKTVSIFRHVTQKAILERPNV